MSCRVKALLSGQVFRYFSSNFLVRGISLLSVFVFSSLLSAADFGLSVVLISVVSISSTFVNFSVSQMIVREKVFLGHDGFSTLVTSALCLSFLLALLLIIVFYCFRLFDFDFRVNENYLLIALICPFFLSVIDLSSKIFVTFKSAIDYAINEMSKVLIGFVFGISLFFLGVLDGVVARFLGYAAGLVVSFIGCFFMIKKYITFLKPDIVYMKKSFIYGCKVFPQLVSNWIKLGADKIILSSMLPFSDIGIYSFSFAVCSVVMLLGAALNNTFAPESMKLYKSGNILKLRRLRRKYTAAMFLSSFVFLFILYFLSQFFWPERYKVDFLVIVLFVFCFFSQTVYLFYAKYFLYQLKITLLSVGNLMVSIAYVMMLYGMSESVTVNLSVIFLAFYSVSIMLWVVCYSTIGEKSMCISSAFRDL